MAERSPLPGPSQLHGSSEPPAKKLKVASVGSPGYDEPTSWEWSVQDRQFQWKFADGLTVDYTDDAVSQMWNAQEVALAAITVGRYWKVGSWRDEPLSPAKPVFRR